MHFLSALRGLDLRACVALVLLLVGLAPMAAADMPKPLRTGAAFQECSQCPEMVVIPGGTFLMGSPASDAERKDLEEPQHEVTVAHRFALGRFPVTRAEYALFAKERGIAGTGCRAWDGKKWEEKPNPDLDWRNPGFPQSDRDPVVCVSWDEAKQYVAWLNSRVAGKTGKKGASAAAGPYRLPTEAEWEIAARAGTVTRYWWGDDVGTNRANCDGCGSAWDDRRTSPVESFPPNPYGLHDMAGNVWQWLEDCWNLNYVGAPRDGSAWLSGNCELRAGRSGAWTRPPRSVRIANRDGQAGHTVNIGFRVARTLE
jgi:formylglycine-generating enzyme required for sulfatase activity